MKPATQSAFVAQAVRQALAPQTKGEQLAGTCLQLPAPSQLPADVTVVPLHDCAAQFVPDGADRQAPAPSHVPSKPQIGAGVHPPWGSLAPSVTGLHAPAAPETLQDEQAEQLAEEQQTPSTQLPLSHSGPEAQS